ncbi:MAG: phosphatase PAP2 family protein [Ignavibacteriaceae bacterium]
MEAQYDSNTTGHYTGANLTIISLIGLFALLFVFFKDKIANADNVAISLIILGIVSVSIIVLSAIIRKPINKAIIQSIFIFGFFSFFYEFISGFQLIIHNQWQDNKLLAIDESLFGSEVSLIMQSIVSPYLTEAMMFAYVFYLPLLIIVAIVAYRRGAAKGLGEYLFILSSGYAICYIGFILFPVASQMYYTPGQYNVALEGGVFTYLGELMRSEAHFPGGNLPSPHCMAATIMLYILFKHDRNLFYLFLPVTVLLYISTVYCRYHYMWDGVIAIALASMLIKIFPIFKKIIYMFLLFRDSIMHPWCITESLLDN